MPLPTTRFRASHVHVHVSSFPPSTKSASWFTCLVETLPLCHPHLTNRQTDRQTVSQSVSPASLPRSGRPTRDITPLLPATNTRLPAPQPLCDSIHPHTAFVCARVCVLACSPSPSSPTLYAFALGGWLSSPSAPPLTWLRPWPRPWPFHQLIVTLVLITIARTRSDINTDTLLLCISIRGSHPCVRLS